MLTLLDAMQAISSRFLSIAQWWSLCGHDLGGGFLGGGFLGGGFEGGC